MRILDTQLLIWACHTPEHLPRALGKRLQKDRDFHFSLASLWEVSIKTSLGKPGFQIDLDDFYLELLKLGFSELPIAFKHIKAAGQLPWLHRDPFDRLLVAAAQVEAGTTPGSTLLTADISLVAYGEFVVLAK
jgi:PIN domain nuclease of toxin-antitoxin system